MNKKNYLVIGGIILFFIITILIILTTKDRKAAWMKDILNSDNYSISMIDCNSSERQLPKETVNNIFNKWNTLSDNGPWTGDNNNCYTKAIITYDKENIVKELELLLIDDSSLVLNIDTTSEYYTNAKEINNYLYNLFK